jgi:hypothetical protein
VPYASEGEGLHLPPVPEALNARATRTDPVRVFTIAQSVLAGLYKIPQSFSQNHDRSCKPVKQNQQFHTNVSDSAHSKSDTVKSASGLNTIHSTCSRQCTVQKPYGDMRLVSFSAACHVRGGGQDENVITAQQHARMMSRYQSVFEIKVIFEVLSIRDWRMEAKE